MRAFVIFIIAISTLLASCNSNNNVKIEADLYASLINTMIAESAHENERASFSYKGAILELKSLDKARLSVLQIGFKRLESSRMEFNALIEPIITAGPKEFTEVTVDKATVNTIVDFILKENQDIYDTIVHIIQGNFMDFNLKEEWKDELLEELSDIHSSLAHDDLMSRGSSEVSDANSLLTVLSLQSFYNQGLRSYEEKLGHLTYGHTAMIFDMYFPVVVEGASGCLSRGDSLQMKIAVGSYSSLISPSTIIIVGNDTLSVDDHGMATFSKKVVNSGEYKLGIKCVLTNPLTGDVGVGESEYVYRVN